MNNIITYAHCRTSALLPLHCVCTRPNFSPFRCVSALRKIRPGDPGRGYNRLHSIILFEQRFMRLRNRDWKRRSDVNSNAYKPREALRVRSKELIFGLIFGLCGSFAGKLKALQEIQPAFQTQCALFSVMVKA